MFEEGDNISVNAFDESEYFISKVYSYSNGVFSSADPIVYANPSQKLSFTAVYPAVESSYEAFDFAMSADQSAYDSYEEADLLVAKVEATSEETPKLVFDHKMVSVNVTVEGADKSDVNVVVYAQNSVSCDVDNDSYEAVGDVAAVTPYESDGVYKAIVAPQFVSSSVDFVVVEIDGESYPTHLSEDVELVSGYKYNLTATFENKSVSLTADINPWEEGDDFTLEQKEDEPAFSLAVSGEYIGYATELSPMLFTTFDANYNYYQLYSGTYTLRYKVEPADADLSEVEWKFVDKQLASPDEESPIVDDGDDSNNIIDIVSMEKNDDIVEFVVKFKLDNSYYFNPYATDDASKWAACDAVALCGEYTDDSGKEYQVISDNLSVDYTFYVKGDLILYNYWRDGDTNNMYLDLTTEAPESESDLNSDSNLKNNIYEFPSTETLDLNGCVAAGMLTGYGYNEFQPLTNYLLRDDWSFKFTILDSFKDANGVNTNEYFTISEDGILSVKPEYASQAVSKNCAIKVEMYSDPTLHNDGSSVVTFTSYFLAKPISAAVELTVGPTEIPYADFYADGEYAVEMSYTQLKEEYLDKVGITYQEFVDTYYVSYVSAYVDGKWKQGTSVTVNMDAANDPNDVFYTLKIADDWYDAAPGESVFYQLKFNPNYDAPATTPKFSVIHEVKVLPAE